MSESTSNELAEARALWRQDRFDQALLKFEAAVAAHPEDPITLIDAARALGERYRISEAVALVKRYLKLAGRSPQSLSLAGQTYRMIHRSGEALACFREAAAGMTIDPAAGLELALLLDRANCLAEAEGVLARLLEQYPQMAEAAFFQNHVRIRSGRREQALEPLREMAADQGHHRYLRTRACYALAEAADKTGDAAEAMRHAAAAKALGQEDAPPLRHIAGLIRNQGDQLLKTFTPEVLARWKKEAASHPPITLLAGHPRSGTTLLEKVLDGHAGLCSSDEHDLFARFIAPPVLQPRNKVGTGDAGKRLIAADERRAASMRRAYFQGIGELLGGPLRGKMLLDKNPSLTELIPAWLRMVPRSKILIMLRDPRDVVLSCFLNYFPLNAYSVAFLTMEETARRYVREMEYWLALHDRISPNQWREVRYEDCVKDLEGTARDTLEWMGLPWSEDVMNYREGLSQRLTQSPTYADVREPVHRRAIGKWQRYQKWIDPVMPILAPVMDRLGYPI